MGRRPFMHGARDRGAAAVEFAIVLPLLLLLVFGIVDFGRALNAQITLTQAAREGVRQAALGQSDTTVVSDTQSAATGLSPVAVTVTDCSTSVLVGTTSAEVDASYQFSFITPIGAIAGLFSGSGPITLTAKGVMPCET